MLAGMAAKTLFDSITRDRPVEWERFLAPLLVSPLVYGVILSMIRSSSGHLPMLIFGFQNGFFWQDVLAGAQGGTEAGL
jgi:hypothetical protein